MSQKESQPAPRWPWAGPVFRVRTARAILEELSARDASDEQWCFAGDDERTRRPGDVARGGRTRRSR
jgi:hypothetical protein